MSEVIWSGAGLGLRSAYLSEILANRPPVPWFEVLIDNYLSKPPVPIAKLESVARTYPLSFHGVGMNLGSVDAPDPTYLSALKTLIQRFNPVAVSDHVCFTAINGRQHHDLLPLPYTTEAVAIFARNVERVQETLSRTIMIENPSSYVSFRNNDMTEWEFIADVCARTGCSVLLDINNVYVSAKNHGFDARVFIESMRACRVGQYHLAGFEDAGTHLLDTHSRPVHAEVWQLFRFAVAELGPRPTLIEWDSNLPDWTILTGEMQRAQQVLDES